MKQIYFMVIASVMLYKVNAQGVWTAKANLNAFKESPGAFSIGTKGYMVSGSQYTQDLWEYDQTSNTWTQKANFPGAGRSLGISFAIGTKGYFGCGNQCCPTNVNFIDFYAWDQGTNTWTAKASYPGNAVWGAFSFAAGGKGYAGGGVAAVTYSNFFQYDPTSDTWTPKANFPGGPRREAAAFGIGNMGYVGTGFNGSSTSYNDLWEYNTVSNTWTAKANFGGSAREGAVGFSIGNKGYIGSGGNNLSDFWEWDQTNNTWVAIANYTGIGRRRAAAFSIGSKGYMGAGTGTALPVDFREWGSCAVAPNAPSAISGSVSFCTSTVAIVYSVAAVAGATSYTWTLPGGWTGTSSNNTISAIPGSNGGNMSVTASNACGTSTASTLSITINPNPTITVNSGPICVGQSFTISPAGANTYTIQGGNAIVSPTANATYTVKGTSSSGCAGVNTATASVTVNALPTISVNSGSICFGQSFTISPGGASSYTIQGGNSIVSPTTTSSYSVVGSSTAGCVSSNTISSSVTVNPLPTVNASSNMSLICVGQSGTLTASGTSIAYTWAPGGSGISITVSPTITSTYTVTGTDAAGCTNSTAITQNVSSCTGIVAVNGIDDLRIFPNPTTDILILSTEGPKIGKIELYNMVGSLMYETDSKTNETEVDLTLYAKGIYFVRVGSVTKRIIKQ